MYLETIQSPSDVKRLPIEGLHVLSEEIRNVLLKKLSEHGGHFGPNFGMVEATIALYSIRQKIKSYMMFPTRVMSIKY